MAQSSSQESPELEATEDVNDEMTMVDFLEEEERMDENMRAVLGASDDQNCTYGMGYVKRQALYSCLTCIPASAKLGENPGICLACSFYCHDNHNLIELYTKRNFRCDCGNSLFPKMKCTLIEDKDNLNPKNKYDQNFSGIYCTCHRPYPDPEKEFEEMIQCVICEDWYHTEHLKVKSYPKPFAEMICIGCVSKHSFLCNYGHLTMSVEAEPETDKPPVPVETKERDEKQKNGAASCLLVGADKIDVGTMFVNITWRENLCRCPSCMKMYEADNLLYMLDSEDQVISYENKGLMKNDKPTTSRYEQGMEALSSLNRTDVIDALQGYNHMKEELKDYLKKFADNKKVVREEDIREFFSQIEARKKPRTELPYFCR